VAGGRQVVRDGERRTQTERLAIAVQVGKDHRVGRHPEAAEMLHNAQAHRAVLGVDAERYPGEPVGLSGGGEDLLLEGLEPVVAGTDLDDPGTHDGPFDVGDKTADEAVGRLDAQGVVRRVVGVAVHAGCGDHL
jgi:hypothetical protein